MTEEGAWEQECYALLLPRVVSHNYRNRRPQAGAFSPPTPRSTTPSTDRPFSVFVPTLTRRAGGGRRLIGAGQGSFHPGPHSLIAPFHGLYPG